MSPDFASKLRTDISPGPNPIIPSGAIPSKYAPVCLLPQLQSREDNGVKPYLRMVKDNFGRVEHHLVEHTPQLWRPGQSFAVCFLQLRPDVIGPQKETLSLTYHQTSI